jgi:methylthioribulose-1-phosphate dehydratase
MIEQTLEFKAQVRALSDAGRLFAARGWVPSTVGHFSARLNDQQIVITNPGRDKGRLDDGSFMVVDLDGHVLSHHREPAAERFLHIVMYRRNPEIGAVLHSHSVAATVLSRARQQGLVLEHYAALRNLPGTRAGQTGVAVPVFADTSDVPQLAAQVDDCMHRYPELSGYLIAGHGLYSWGRSVEAAVQHIETFEFMFECEVLSRTLSR